MDIDRKMIQKASKFRKTDFLESPPVPEDELKLQQNIQQLSRRKRVFKIIEEQNSVGKDILPNVNNDLEALSNQYLSFSFFRIPTPIQGTEMEHNSTPVEENNPFADGNKIKLMEDLIDESPLWDYESGRQNIDQDLSVLNTTLENLNDSASILENHDIFQQIQTFIKNPDISNSQYSTESILEMAETMTETIIKEFNQYKTTTYSTLEKYLESFETKIPIQKTNLEEENNSLSEEYQDIDEDGGENISSSLNSPNMTAREERAFKPEISPSDIPNISIESESNDTGTETEQKKPSETKSESENSSMALTLSQSKDNYDQSNEKSTLKSPRPKSRQSTTSTPRNSKDGPESSSKPNKKNSKSKNKKGKSKTSSKTKRNRFTTFIEDQSKSPLFLKFGSVNFAKMLLFCHHKNNFLISDYVPPLPVFPFHRNTLSPDNISQEDLRGESSVEYGPTNLPYPHCSFTSGSLAIYHWVSLRSNLEFSSLPAELIVRESIYDTVQAILTQVDFDNSELATALSELKRQKKSKTPQKGDISGAGIGNQSLETTGIDSDSLEDTDTFTDTDTDHPNSNSKLTGNSSTTFDGTKRNSANSNALKKALLTSVKNAKKNKRLKSTRKVSQSNTNRTSRSVSSKLTSKSRKKLEILEFASDIWSVSLGYPVGTTAAMAAREAERARLSSLKKSRAPKKGKKKAGNSKGATSNGTGKGKKQNSKTKNSSNKTKNKGTQNKNKKTSLAPSKKVPTTRPSSSISRNSIRSRSQSSKSKKSRKSSKKSNVDLFLETELGQYERERDSILKPFKIDESMLSSTVNALLKETDLGITYDDDTIHHQLDPSDSSLLNSTTRSPLPPPLPIFENENLPVDIFSNLSYIQPVQSIAGIDWEKLLPNTETKNYLEASQETDSFIVFLINMMRHQNEEFAGSIDRTKETWNNLTQSTLIHMNQEFQQKWDAANSLMKEHHSLSGETLSLDFLSSHDILTSHFSKHLQSFIEMFRTKSRKIFALRNTLSRLKLVNSLKEKENSVRISYLQSKIETENQIVKNLMFKKRILSKKLLNLGSEFDQICLTSKFELSSLAKQNESTKEKWASSKLYCSRFTISSCRNIFKIWFRQRCETQTNVLLLFAADKFITESILGYIWTPPKFFPWDISPYTNQWISLATQCLESYTDSFGNLKPGRFPRNQFLSENPNFATEEHIPYSYQSSDCTDPIFDDNMSDISLSDANDWNTRYPPSKTAKITSLPSGQIVIETLFGKWALDSSFTAGDLNVYVLAALLRLHPHIRASPRNIPSSTQLLKELFSDYNTAIGNENHTPIDSTFIPSTPNLLDWSSISSLFENIFSTAPLTSTFDYNTISMMIFNDSLGTGSHEVDPMDMNIMDSQSQQKSATPSEIQHSSPRNPQLNKNHNIRNLKNLSDSQLISLIQKKQPIYGKKTPIDPDTIFQPRLLSEISNNFQDNPPHSVGKKKLGNDSESSTYNLPEVTKIPEREEPQEPQEPEEYWESLSLIENIEKGHLYNANKLQESNHDSTSVSKPLVENENENEVIHALLNIDNIPEFFSSSKIQTFNNANEHENTHKYRTTTTVPKNIKINPNITMKMIHKNSSFPQWLNNVTLDPSIDPFWNATLLVISKQMTSVWKVLADEMCSLNKINSKYKNRQQHIKKHPPKQRSKILS